MSENKISKCANNSAVNWVLLTEFFFFFFLLRMSNVLYSGTSGFLKKENNELESHELGKNIWLCNQETRETGIKYKE